MTRFQRCRLSARSFLTTGAALGSLALVSGCALARTFIVPPRQLSMAIRGSRRSQRPRRRKFRWWGTALRHRAGDRASVVDAVRVAALNALIETAIKNNPTLATAQAALRQAMELVYAQQGFFYPNVQINLSPSRQRTSATLAPPLNTNQLTYNLFTSQVSVGFTPDVFGGNRRQVESLRAQADAQRFQLEATYVTLTSNVVTAAVQEASLRAQIAATEEIIGISTKSLTLVRRQFELGAVAGLDVAAQEAALAQVKQTLPPLQKQLEQNRNLIIALAGALPSEDLGEQFELAALHLPQDLPVSLPSKLVEQRPDVRAAEAEMHSASAEIGVGDRKPAAAVHNHRGVRRYLDYV